MNPATTVFGNYQVLEVGALARIKTDNVKGLRPLLTVKSTGDKEFTLKLYHDAERKNEIWVPRALVPCKQAYRTTDEFESIRDCFFRNITPRPIQEEALSLYLSALREHPFGGIIKAPMGSGKTVMGIYLIEEIGYKTLIVVPTERIFSQWIERLKAFSNLKDEDIGIIRGSKRVVNKPVVIGMIHTLAKNKWADIRNMFGHIIFDEVHTLGAETFSIVASLFDCKIRTGLSATPRRKDGTEKVFEWHIGPVLAEVEQKSTPPKVIQVYYKSRLTDHGKISEYLPSCIYGGKLSLGAYYNRLETEHQRTRLIAKYAIDAFQHGHSVLILTERLDHVEWLTMLIQKKIGYDNVGRITGQYKEVTRPVVVATYGSAGMGLDIPALSCVIFGMPRVDIEQPMGRILRILEGKRNPVIVDFIDSCSSVMMKWRWKREQFYKGKGCKIFKRFHERKTQ